MSEENLDRPTGRYYCVTCFSFTVEEQFREMQKDTQELEYYIEDDTDVLVEFPHQVMHEIEDHGDENDPF